ncbi:zinc finger, CCHC-type containing protein [Tanacetum coccineum]
MPELLKDDTVEAIRRRAKWKNDDYICRGHILNSMSDPLFDIYQNVKSANELWDYLESKYMADDASSKKFLVSNFNNYKLVDSRPVIEQFNELLIILEQYTLHGLKMDESISVLSVIGKLPPSWKEFKHTLKHGKDKRVERIKTTNKTKERNVVSRRTTMVLLPTRTLNWNIGSVAKLVTLRGIVIVETRRITKVLVVQERGLRTNPKTKVDAIAWWIYSGATTHVCKDHCWFKTYELVKDGYVLYMSDDHFAPFHEKGSVVLEFSSEKSITLFNVLYVPKLRKNLISDPVLNKSGYKQVYESDKYILSKSGVFVEFDCYNNGMFILNLNKVPDDSGFVYISSSIRKIRTYNEAMQSRDDAFWKETIDNEIGSIMENNSWVLSDLPLGYKPLGCKWIFKRKIKVDGTINKFKARLVIQGFRQKEWIDYFDTYAPVARITTIRLLLALAAIHNLVIHQMDVKTSFLNGDLEEEVYMKQPEGFIMPCSEHKTFLSSKFSMKDMGEADVILGIKIKRENKGIVITQSHYIEKILKKFNRKDCSPVSTPMDPLEKLMPNTGKPVDQLEYSRAIGCLMYSMMSTRPDIAYAVGRLRRVTSNPSRQHWHAITRVFKYLKGVMNYGLSYVRYPSVLEAYSDAGWINHVEDSSSTSGWVFLLRRGAISWASKNQTCITGSTMESEFVALAEWLRNLIHEFQYGRNQYH